MVDQRGFFDLDERYVMLSKAGDPPKRLSRVIDFEIFRPELDAALNRSDGSKGGRPPMDPVLMFKVLVIQALDGLPDAEVKFQILDRRSFRRFLGLDDGDRVPDGTTIWRFCEALVQAKAVDRLFARFDAYLKDAGYLAMGGLLDRDNTGSEIWADTAYRSQKNEKKIARAGLTSKIHFRKPPRKTLPAHHERANATRSKVRFAVEHPFAEMKSRMGLFVRTIGTGRATAKIGMANIAFNMKRLVFWERTATIQ